MSEALRQFGGPIGDVIRPAVERILAARLAERGNETTEVPDERWDMAVDWLLNSRYATDAGPLFWAYYDRIITLDELRSESTDKGSVWDVIEERRAHADRTEVSL